MEQLRLQFITPFVGEDFFTVVKHGIRDAAALFGADVAFTGTEGDDCAALAGLMDDAVCDGVDGLIVSVVDAAQLNEPIARARAAGIPVIAFNIAGDADTQVLCTVSQDVYAAGVRIGARAAARLDARAHVLVTLHDDVQVLQSRADGIESALGRRQILRRVVGNSPDLAAANIRTVLAEHPEICAVLGTGQSDTEGAGIVAREMGSARALYVAGFDVAPGLLSMIESGIVDCTIDQQPYVQGFYPVMQLCQNLRCGISPSDVDAGNALIDRENVAAVIRHAKAGYR